MTADFHFVSKESIGLDAKLLQDMKPRGCVSPLVRIEGMEGAFGLPSMPDNGPTGGDWLFARNEGGNVCGYLVYYEKGWRVSAAGQADVPGFLAWLETTILRAAAAAQND